jgi:Flp pilus assembly pilin Flp
MLQRITFKATRLAGVLKREDGQGATEYAMVIAFVIVGLTVTLGALGVGINEFLADVKGELEGLIDG